MSTNYEVDTLRRQEYLLRLKVNQLRREVFQQPDPTTSNKLFATLETAEAELSKLEQKRAEAENADVSSGLIFDVQQEPDGGVLGPDTTGLHAQAYLRMSQVPTSFYHLLSDTYSPLVSCRVVNAIGDSKRRVRVTAYIDGYSAHAVDTFELDPSGEHTFDLLPTLFRDPISTLNELTRAMLNVLVEDLDTKKVEIHKTYPIWLLARTTAPLYVKDSKTGKWFDMTPYLGAYVTPNSLPIMEFLRQAVEYHTGKHFVGYQIGEAEIEPQVKALFDALQKVPDVKYVNSVIDFSPDQGSINQRVRLPKESLAHREANCIDGTVLFASLLEAISLSPAIVLIPGHAFVAWETWQDSNQWKFLETTMIATHSFEDACKSAEQTAKTYKALAETNHDPSRFRLWPLRELRTKYGIMPME